MAFSDISATKVGDLETKIKPDDDGGKTGAKHSVPSGLKKLWLEFLEKTSIHGCSHLSADRQMGVVRFIWAILTIAMGTGLGYVLIQLFFRYREYPFTSHWSARQKANIEMPAITLCLPTALNMDSIDNSTFLYDYVSKTRSYFGLDYYFDSVKEKEEYLEKAEDLMSRLSMSEFNALTNYQFRDIFLVVLFKDKILNETSPLLKRKQSKWKSCWVFNGEDSGLTATRFDELTIVADVNSDRFPANVLHTGLEVIFYESGKSSFFLLQKTHFLKPGTYSHIYYDRVEHHYLNLPYGSFEGKGCLKTDSYESVNASARAAYKYSYEACIEKLFLFNIISKCECVEPEYLRYFPNVSECSVWQIDNCIVPIEIQSSQNEIFLTGDFEKQGCQRECNFATYDVSITTAGFPNKHSMPFIRAITPSDSLEYARENLIFVSIRANDDSVEIITHSPEITLLDIFGIVGGYVGLFLGASLLSLAEIFETLIFSFCFLMRRVGTRIVKMSGSTRVG